MKDLRQNMRWFNIDQHISVVADLKNIFESLGHTIDDVCLSSHAVIMGREKDSIPMLDGDKWCGFINQKKWDEFFNTYSALEEYDGFICCYPPIFSYLYKRFSKPIIIDIPIRYEYPCQSDAKDWLDFNSYLQEGVDSKRIYLVANNLYDKMYAEMFLQRQVNYIPSLCLYTGMQYNPLRNEYLYYSAKPFSEFAGSNIKRKHDVLPFGHPWQKVAEYSGIVHFPYNVSTMSTFEQYSANIPIFCPSLDMLIDLYKKGKAYRVMEQVSWCATFGRPAGSVIPFNSKFDPNKFDDLESIRFWMQFADYYNADAMPHIIHFNSFDELKDQTMHADLQKISSEMRSFNSMKKQIVTEQWKKLIEEVGHDHGL